MTRRPRPAAVGVALLATAALAGCAAGQSAQVYKSRTSGDSTNTSVGSLALRNLAIQAPSTGIALLAGSNAVLTGSFVNQGDQPDMLVSASTDVAPVITLEKGNAVVKDISVPPLGLSSSDSTLVLRGLTRPLRPGEFVAVTLDFAQNGRIRVLVPVQNDPTRARGATGTAGSGEP